MKTQRVFSLLCTAAFLVGSIGCGPNNIVSSDPRTVTKLVLATSTPTPTPTHPIETTAATATPTAAADQTGQGQPPQPVSVGPNPSDVPQGYNPLTGLPVDDPSLLSLPAVLISITNFPPSSRPQAGLSFSPWVFEMYISEGMTRFLAAFYGDFPHATNSDPGNGKKPVTNADVGPVRSGRLPYVYIHEFFQDSCLVYAGATYQIRNKLKGCAQVFGNDSTNINSAMLDVSRLERIAEQNKQPGQTFNYTGNLFAAQPPAQGAAANIISVFYSFLNQSQWQYDSASGQYLKFDDYADGSGRFQPATDRLTGQQLAFSNVIVLFAEHDTIQPYIIDIKLDAGEKGKAVVFRDGQCFDVFWTTVSGDYEQSTGLRRPIRFVDANGNPFALKPGASWVHVVTPASEILDQGGGSWLVRFYAPAGAK